MKESSQNSNSKKIINSVFTVIERCFGLLMAVQILFGIVWITKNIGHEAWFHETQVYLKASANLVIDEYMGMLYPLLIRLTRGIENTAGVPYYVTIYIIQLGAALFSTVHFLCQRNWMKDTGRTGHFLKWFTALYVVTFPMLLQLHLAVLPYSLAASVFVLLISEGLYGMKNKQSICGKTLLKVCGLWILGYVLLPDYGWLMGIFVCSVFVKILIWNRKWATRLFMALLSMVLCFGVIAGSTQTFGSMGRMQRTVGSAMVHRFVWPYFVMDSFFWDERINSTFAYYELVEFAQSPEAVDYKFGPVLEEKYGKEEANDIYWEMAATSFKLGSKLTLRNIGRDFFVNLCPQAGVQMLLKNNDSSLIAWNYGRMQDHAPIVAKYYLDFSLTGWNVMCLLGILVVINKEIMDRRKKQRASTSADKAVYGVEVKDADSSGEDRVDMKDVHGFGGNGADVKALNGSGVEGADVKATDGSGGWGADIRQADGSDRCGAVLWICMLCMAVWYTMSNGMQDYKYVILNSFLWLTPVIKGFFNMRISQKNF